MKLNVGCGLDPDGDIRVDITRLHWLSGQTTANVIADAQRLPFRDKCFDELKAYHLLEHLADWQKGLSELCRVSKSVDIVFPIDTYMPHNAWRILFSLPTPSRLRFFSKLPARTRQHLWQFKNKTHIVLATIKGHGFVSQLSYVDMPIFRFLAHSRIDRYLGSPFSRLKKRFQYRIKAHSIQD